MASKSAAQIRGPEMMGMNAAESSRAFDSARRHSRYVRRMRAGLVAAVATVAIVLGAHSLFGAFTALAPGLSLGELSINGAKITMNAPRLTGSRRDGEGYVVTAAKAEQDIAHPSGVDLTSVQGDITTADHDVLHLVAAKGHYETDREALELGGGVMLINARYLAHLETVQIDFKAGVYNSDQPVSVRVLPDTSIVADGLSIRDNGALVQFAGHVKTIIHAEDQGLASSAGHEANP